MGDLSKNLSRAEFTCQCGCGSDTVDYELVMVLQEAREHFGEALTINSGCRCMKHNRNEGGSKKSQHIIGRAADIRINNVPSDIIADYLEDKYPDTFGIGRYSGRVHIDTRMIKARWDNR